MRNLKKVFALMLALLMAVALVPSKEAYAATTEPAETKVILTKMLLTSLSGWPTQTGLDGSQYTGTKVDEQKFFGTAEVRPGTAFTVKNERGQYLQTKDGKTWLDTPYYFLTESNGQFDVTLPKGTYTFTEDLTQSKPSTDGKEITGSAAVPLTITLPMVKADGNYFDTTDAVYIYPKNMQDIPTVTKERTDGKNLTTGNQVGDSIPFKVTSKIPANSQYATFNYEDVMTKGLTFTNDSLTVTYSGGTLIKGTDYKVLQGANGFKLMFTEQGLTKINKKATEQTLTLEYKAILNETAVPDVKENNKVKLEYGNRPTKNTTDLNPQNQTITVDKKWATGAWPSGVKAIFDVYDNTGLLVGTIELDVNKQSDKLTGLDDAKTYTVVERMISGYTATNMTPSNGTVSVTNGTTTNPNPLEPNPVEVVTFGKKFVKMSQTEANKRLANARFVIQNAENKYLALKDDATREAELKAYIDAENNYQNAIKVYNEANAKDPKPANLETLKTAIADTKKIRDEKYEAMKMEWTWLDAVSGGVPTNAHVLVSDENGKFEIKGLAAGEYKLVETQAPSGYAKITTPVTFTVGANTYTSGNVEYNVGDADKQAQQVNNVKVIIPQTGGIGTVIFTVVGLAVMIGAFIVMKRRNAEAE